MMPVTALTLSYEDVAPALSAELQAKLMELASDPSLIFQCHLDIDSTIASFDSVLAVNEDAVRITDPAHEVQRRLDEIVSTRTLVLACLRVDEEGLEHEVFSTPFPILPQVREMLRGQIEADVQRELEWVALGDEGQESAISSTLGVLADAGHFVGLRNVSKEDDALI
jgi:hypothetical protein